MPCVDRATRAAGVGMIFYWFGLVRRDATGISVSLLLKYIIKNIRVRRVYYVYVDMYAKTYISSLCCTYLHVIGPKRGCQYILKQEISTRYPSTSSIRLGVRQMVGAAPQTRTTLFCSRQQIALLGIPGSLPALPELRTSHKRRNVLPDHAENEECHYNGHDGRDVKVMCKG